MNAPAILAYYTERKAELDSLGVSIPNDLERIGLLREDVDKLQCKCSDCEYEVIENLPVIF